MSDVRRLPVYLVVDCSESMAGAVFQGVERGLESLVNELKCDPHALETVWLSLITFSHRAKVAVPLTELSQFSLPKLQLGVGTSFGAALQLLRQCLAKDVISQTADRKGDWKPIVLLMTDGEPTDSWETVADEFRSEISGAKARLVAVAYGSEFNISNLKRLTPNVCRINSPDAAILKSFFRWITQSVTLASSRAVGGAGGGDDMPALPAGIEVEFEPVERVSQDSIFLFFRCQKTKALYISRYKRIPEHIIAEIRAERSLALSAAEYFQGVEANTVTDFDFEGSGSALKLSISSESLLAAPACPYCGNDAWALCAICGRTFCFAAPGKCQCPWCQTWGNYSLASEKLEVGRTLG